MRWQTDDYEQSSTCYVLDTHIDCLSSFLLLHQQQPLALLFLLLCRFWVTPKAFLLMLAWHYLLLPLLCYCCWFFAACFC